MAPAATTPSPNASVRATFVQCFCVPTCRRDGTGAERRQAQSSAMVNRGLVAQCVASSGAKLVKLAPERVALSADHATGGT